MKSNYYDILGVTSECELDEIKAAYRRLARKYHPDIAPDSIDKFKEINEAYTILSNEKKRKQYDMLFGFYKPKQETKTNNKNDFKQDTTYHYKNTTHKTYNTQTKTQKEQKKEDKNFFDDIFFASKTEKSIAKDGSDLNAEISITIPEAQNGTTKIVNILHSELCPRCKGRKFINGASCSECDGTGEKIKQRKLTVKIPSGVKHNTKLRIKEEGNAGINGGKNGDLFLNIKIESTQNIHYEGKTVHYNVPLEPFEAVLGTKISLKTLEGNIQIKIPPRTKNGQKFRIQEQIENKIFEIFVTVHIEIPTYLSEDEIRLYEKLKKLSNTDIRRNFINES